MYEPACQTTGVRRWRCPSCGRDNLTRVLAGSARAQCHNDACHCQYILGTAVFSIAKGRQGRPPCDLAWPQSPQDANLSPITALPTDELTPTANEPTIYAGVWRSAEPICLFLPAELDRAKLYIDRDSGELWLGQDVAAGSRYLAQPLYGDRSQRIYVGHREWRERMKLCEEAEKD
jgi:hypothetical protein